MQGKTVVITGGTSGIGEIAALRLSQRGARVALVARDLNRGRATLEKLQRANGAANHTVYYSDLSTLAGMRSAAAEILDTEPRIDVLMNNAGALFNSRQVTADGLEKTFAVNHMAYFVLTNLLLERLKATPGARIVSTASNAHAAAPIDFDDLQSAKKYGGFTVYAKSKLANILFTRELAKRLSGTGVTANCLHPGFVATRFGDQSGGFVQFGLRVVKPVAGISREKGAQTMIYLAASPVVADVSGLYFVKSAPVTPSKAAQNDADAERLWEESAKIAGVG